MLKIILTLSLAATAAFAQPNPDAILKKADEIRNPSDSFKMTITVQSEDKEQKFEVMLKGKDKTMIVAKAPARDVGRNMLMLSRDFYAYIPNLRRAVRLSLAQKLSGQVANGDIARLRWHGDYKASLEKDTGKEYVLFLDGTQENLTYQKIRLWVDKRSNRPVKAEYLALDGKTLLKRSYFENYKVLAGAERPSQIRIEDVSGKKSLIVVNSMTSTNLADSIFSERNLETLR